MLIRKSPGFDSTDLKHESSVCLDDVHKLISCSFRVPLVKRDPPGRMVSLVRGYDSRIQLSLLFPEIPLCLLTTAVCFQGDRGDPGPEGLAGAAGSTGPEGPVGFTGSPGDRGNNVSVPPTNLTDPNDSSCHSSRTFVFRENMAPLDLQAPQESGEKWDPRALRGRKVQQETKECGARRATEGSLGSTVYLEQL